MAALAVAIATLAVLCAVAAVVSIVESSRARHTRFLRRGFDDNTPISRTTDELGAIFCLATIAAVLAGLAALAG